MTFLQRMIPLLFIIIFFGCKSATKSNYVIPSEFEQQEYIWLSWNETGFLGGDPFYTTIIETIKEIHPYVKVKIFYGPQLNFDQEQMQSRIYDLLLTNKIDTSKITLFYNEQPYGAIQDPGPIFLRNEKGELSIADFDFLHPDKRSASIDRNVAIKMNVPTVSSTMISEGGAWQTNGEGTMLAVESVELDRNKNMTKVQIEDEYKRVLGVSKIIWLKNGLKEEEWGKLENGIYGIGTGGHIDEFCRFVNDNTVLLAKVDEKDTVGNEIMKESYRRMEANYLALLQSTTKDGKPIKIIRLPAGPLITKKLLLKELRDEEKSWFANEKTDSVEFYLATGYMNFVIANQVVVTAKFWNEGLPDEYKKTDAAAKQILEQAFPGRKIVQINCMPLHHDGAGLHCHSRNEPTTKTK